jgi:hypothetical protein
MVVAVPRYIKSGASGGREKTSLKGAGVFLHVERFLSKWRLARSSSDASPRQSCRFAELAICTPCISVTAALPIAISLIVSASTQNSPSSKQALSNDGTLVAELAECDNQAAQQRDTVSKQRPLDPISLLSPFLLMNDLDARRRQEADQPRLLAEIERQRRQCQQQAEGAAKRREQEIANQRRDSERGYRRISLETFLLDGRDLAARAAKVSLKGAYFPEENIGLLFTDQAAVAKATMYPEIGRNEPRITLLTDSATRETRQYLLRCRSHPGAAQVGCPITIIGRATICALASPLGGKRELPCVTVEEGRP